MRSTASGATPTAAPATADGAIPQRWIPHAGCTGCNRAFLRSALHRPGVVLSGVQPNGLHARRSLTLASSRGRRTPPSPLLQCQVRFAFCGPSCDLASCPPDRGDVGCRAVRRGWRCLVVGQFDPWLLPCKTGGVRKFRLSRLLREPSGETVTRSESAKLRLGEDRANMLLGDLDAGVQRPSGEPAPVEADEDAWQREREQRERDGRS
jgi:hypothetical protein